MKKRIVKTYMTKFDYLVRGFAFVIGIMFIATLAFLSPMLDQATKSHTENNDKISLLKVENNVLKLQLNNNISTVRLDNIPR